MGNAKILKECSLRNITYLLTVILLLVLRLCLETAILNQCGCVDARFSIVWHKANESHPYCGDIKLPPEKAKIVHKVRFANEVITEKALYEKLSDRLSFSTL